MTELELDCLHQKVQDLGVNVENTLIKSRVHSCQCDRKMERIKSYLQNQSNKDSEEELDILTEVVNSNSDRLQAMEDKDFSTQIGNLNDKLSATYDMLAAMEEEHQERIQEIADGVSGNARQIENVQELFGGIMKHQLIREEDYEALGTPDDNTLYFTYE